MSSALIQLDRVSFSYTKSSRALADIDLSIEHGELTALIGNNGSGKSTLMKLIVGLLKPTSGTVRVAGQDTRKARVSQLAQQIGFIFQNPNDQLFAQTVEDEIRFGLRNLRLPHDEIEQRTEETLRRFRLESVRSVFPRFLSRGDKQKVCIASVVAMRPQVLLLDEPTTGQDHRDARAILDLASELNESGTTILLVTHDLVNVAAYARRVVVLRDGVILRDAPTLEVMTDLPMLEACSLVSPAIVQLSLCLADLGIPVAARPNDLVDAVRSRRAAARTQP